MTRQRARRAGLPSTRRSRALRVPGDAGAAPDDAAGGAALGPRSAIVRGGRGRFDTMRVPATDRIGGCRAGRRISRGPGARRVADTTVGAHRRAPTFVSETSADCYHACHELLSTVDVVGRRAVFQLRPGAGYDEMFDAGGDAAPALSARFFDELRVVVAERARLATGRGRQGVSHPGHHVHRLRRRRGHRADLPVRPAAADHHRGGVADARSAA